jgi:hypothetical protein
MNIYEIIYTVYNIIQGTCCCAQREATRVIESVDITSIYKPMRYTKACDRHNIQCVCTCFLRSIDLKTRELHEYRVLDRWWKHQDVYAWWWDACILLGSLEVWCICVFYQDWFMYESYVHVESDGWQASKSSSLRTLLMTRRLHAESTFPRSGTLRFSRHLHSRAHL